MTRRENLQEQYEDALFALLMDDLAWQEGERLLEENERLKNDPDAEVPEEVMARCRRVINREFAKKQASKVGRTSWNVLKRVAAVACVTVLLFTVALAASETVRINTLNLVISVFDRYTDYSFVPTSEVSADTAISGYEVGWVPEGFVLTEQDHNQYRTWNYYERDSNEVLRVTLETFSEGAVTSVDTEDAVVEEITINGQSITLVTKDYYHAIVSFPESRQMLFVVYHPNDVIPEKDNFIKILENITLTQ